MNGIGSSKVRNAKKRMNKEHKFLGTLSVQCDEESGIDLVHDDSGNLLPITQLVKVVSGQSHIMRFVRDGVMVELADVRASLDVIASCKETVKRFTGK